MAVSGGHWVWPAVFLIFSTVVYSRTIASEGRLLGNRFPDLYATYSMEVPSFLPRVTPYRASGGSDDPSAGFRWSHSRRNRDWEASLGALATIGCLTTHVVPRVD